MAELTKHLKRVIRHKVTNKTMELLVGLNEKNHRDIFIMVQHHSKKLVKAYINAIKKQSNQLEKVNKQIKITKATVAYIEPASVAS